VDGKALRRWCWQNSEIVRNKNIINVLKTAVKLYKNTIHKPNCGVASFSTFDRERVNRVFSLHMSLRATDCLRAAG